MFDNPFDSFHNAVAEAKEEREQLDRLLTISTPRERLLVIVISVTVAAFCAWLFFGQVTQSVAINGTLTFNEGSAQSTKTRSKAITSAESSWLTREQVSQISAGLGAAIDVTMSDGETITINGTVSRIDTGLKTGDLQPSSTNMEEGFYRVFFQLNDEIDANAIGDKNCRIAIELGKQSPISLFGMRSV